MNTIELKNFRNFEHLDRMSLKGVTMLVGTNNAGKSTITKAYQLLGDNLYKIMKGVDIETLQYPQFDFSSVCGNFKRALSSRAKDEMIEFSIQKGMFEITIRVAQSVKTDSSFANIKYVKIVDIIDDCMWEYDLSKFNELVSTFTYSGKFLANITRLKELKYINHNLPCMSLLKSKDEVTQKVAMEKNMTVEELRAYTQNSFMAKLNQFHQIEQQYETIENKLVKKLDGSTLIPFDIIDEKVVLDGVHTDFETGRNIDANLQIKLDEDTKIFNDFFEYIKVNLNRALASDAIVYVPANEATHDSYFRINETYNMDYATTIINRFYKQYSDRRKWVENMLKKMGIGETFNIKQVNSDFLYVSITKQGGEEFPLADMGKGAIQLFLKILHLSILCSMSNYDDNICWSELEIDFKRGLKRYEEIDQIKVDKDLRKRLVIIEEPEQNLHPASQSKLADLFLEVSKLGVNVLVETHSEYLVRRSQVLVAEAKYKNEQELAEKCPFKVYYMPKPEEGKPYDMEYMPTGGFKNSFGNGFFDEAGKLDIIVLRNESSLKRR